MLHDVRRGQLTLPQAPHVHEPGGCCPVWAWNSPARQAAQAPFPEPASPTAQKLHVVPPAAAPRSVLEPAAQSVQLTTLVAAPVYLPAGHAPQKLDPAAVWPVLLPAGHVLQSEPSSHEVGEGQSTVHA